MKIKNAIAFIAACLMLPCSYAQSNITLYGLIDNSVEISNVGNGTTARMDSGGQLGSRFGLKGSEDIGGGNRVNFVLEQGIGSNDGTASNPAQAFSRQAWVGVSGNWGELRFGLQNSPLYIFANNYLDSFTVATIGSALASFQTLVPRVNNAISYHTPDFNGLTAQFMIGLRDQTTLPSSGVQSYHVAIEYNKGPLSAATAYQQVANVTNSASLKVLTVGASYAFGALRVYGGFHTSRETDGSLDKNVYVTSLSYMFGTASMLSLGYGHAQDKTAASNNGDQVGLMYWYFLSKRDTLYAAAAFLQNHNDATYRMNGATTVGIPVAYPGADARGIQFGIQHRF
jgi:predicted porin